VQTTLQRNLSNVGKGREARYERIREAQLTIFMSLMICEAKRMIERCHLCFKFETLGEY
jgi:hypothetical protein